MLARELNLSETSFVFPPADPKHAAKVRIFTPLAEMAFAGHPTIGTAFVLTALGRIPDGAWVLFRTGWQSRAQDQTAFLNVGANGPETPGPDVDASRWLAEARQILGFGTETVGIDAGAAGGFDPPFPLHNFLLGAGRLGLTQLANLDKLPVSGALLVVSPLRLVGGTGSPSRVFAFVPKG